VNKYTVLATYLWTYDLNGPVSNVFDAGKSIKRASAKWELGGWALEIETFLSPVKWHRVVRRVPFGTKKIDKQHY
jgi:hypothetical protein